MHEIITIGDDTHAQLSEHGTVRAHRGIAPKFHTLSADHPRTYLSGGSVNLIPFFFHIFLFSIPLMRYARYAPGGEKDTLFTRFYWRRWCTGPNETCRGGGGGGFNFPQSPLTILWDFETVAIRTWIAAFDILIRTYSVGLFYYLGFFY